MSAKENEALVRRLYDCFNQRKLDEIGQWCTDDYELVNVPFNMALSGKDAVKQFDQAWLDAFPDGQVEITSMVCSEDMCCVEYTGRGTHTGPLMIAEGTLEPTGREAELHLCDVSTFEGGKVASTNCYYDVHSLLAQLGVGEEEEAEAGAGLSSEQPGSSLH
jgi:predicted ester cyclase